MIHEIEELVNKRQKWVEANRENGFELGLKRLLTDLYPDNAHFIYELLQNAEDAHAQTVRFILYENSLEFEHDGKRLFSSKDIDAITSIGFSTKRDDNTKIGKFGVGFKAVFAYTDSPEIESGHFNFCIRDMVVPEPKERAEKQNEINHTRFVLPFNNVKKPPKRAYGEIEKLLKELDATSLLFLTHIRKIEYLFPDSSLGYIERFDLGNHRFEIRVQQPGQQSSLSTFFLKFDKVVQVIDEEAEGEFHRQKSCLIAVAFGLSRPDPKSGKANDEENKFGWELVPLAPGRVCIYFPADKETSNLRFYLHAPFASTVARDSVRDCAGNNILRNQLAELLAESMHVIRDQNLLTVQALALLPNNKDNLSEFYKPIMGRLVQEFKEKKLVPMKKGGHAAAFAIFRGTKILSDLIDDRDMALLLDIGDTTPIWVSNPPQRNQREDNFLSMLEIKQWETANLVEALSKMEEDVRSKWMSRKDEQWHQTLYEMLLELDTAPKYLFSEAGNRKVAILQIDLIRCSDGKYRKGNSCYFPTEEIEHDHKLPRVAKGVYQSNKERNEKVYQFLVKVGVREVDEEVEIELLLKEQYSQEAVDQKAFKPEITHIKRFIEFIRKHPAKTEELQKCYILKLENDKWGKPCQVYLDTPFMDTDLKIWYETFKNTENKHALSRDYEKLDINPKEIGVFVRQLGAITTLQVKEIAVSQNHPEWKEMVSAARGNSSAYGLNIDYCILNLKEFFASPLTSKSRLVWRTMVEWCCDEYLQYNEYLQARYAKNRSWASYDAKSTLVHDLRAAKWVPQKSKDDNFVFVCPREATAEKLPEGFEYQTGWQWLRDIEFGIDIQRQADERRQEQDRQSANFKQNEAVIKGIGFESLEVAEKIARCLKDDPGLYSRLVNKPRKAEFPTQPVNNPERRQERVDAQLADAPAKAYERRDRSVRTSNKSIDPITWLRNQYTNDDDQMVCQICKEEMPFRKRDEKYYFEKKELLSRKYLPNEHEAQNLALCPLCAAKYNEFVINDDNAMTKLKETILNTEGCVIPISLGAEQTSIRFVETHYHDLRIILSKVD